MHVGREVQGARPPRQQLPHVPFCHREGRPMGAVGSQRHGTATGEHGVPAQGHAASGACHRNIRCSSRKGHQHQPSGPGEQKERVRLRAERGVNTREKKEHIHWADGLRQRAGCRDADRPRGRHGQLTAGLKGSLGLVLQLGVLCFL